MEPQVFEVSKTGTGAYRTIADALAAAERAVPDVEETVTIHLAPGTYCEKVELRRPNLVLEGETAESVRIVSDRGAFAEAADGLPYGTFRTYAVLVDAPDVTLKNLTIENAAGDGRTAGQGIALYADGDRLVVDSCCILGHQDTLFCGPLPKKERKPGGFRGPKEKSPRVKTRQYYTRCLVQGDVDFIFGSGCAYFDGCEISSLERGEKVNGYVCAASTPEGEPFGFVFHGCSFTGDVRKGTVFLGRPWREHAKTLLLDCWLGPHISRKGWHGWGEEDAFGDASYAGWKLAGPGAEDCQWPSFAKMLDEKEATRCSRAAVLGGSDGWDPRGGADEPVETEHLAEGGRTLHIGRYLSDEDAFARRFDKTARSARFRGGDASSWKAWAEGARQRLADVLGLSLLGPASGEAKVVKTEELPSGIARTLLELDCGEGVWMPVYLLVPARPKTDGEGRRLCMIAPHGHQGAGAASVAGLRGIPAVDEAIRRFNYDYGLKLAELGYVVACPEARGWGARRAPKGQGDTEELFLRGTCLNEARMAEPLGLTLMGLLVSDLMHLVDYLLAQEGVSPDGLGCVGFSGGGMQTLYLSALDERIRKVFISGYLYGVKDALLHLNGNCSCNYVPGLWRLFDMGDIASLIAPRPLVVQSADHDHLNGPRGLANVEEQLSIVRRAYGLLRHEDRIRWEVIPGEHHFGCEHLEEDLAWLDGQEEGKGRI